MANEKGNTRARNWCMIVYPESAPSNWQAILDDMQVQWAASPLHDKDVNDDGEIKKAHWHVVLRFSGMKSYTQILEITQALNAPVPKVCRDLRSSVRYFLHLDNPSKYQYKASDIDSRGGFDAMQYLEASTTEKRQALKDLLQYCKDEHITEYAELLDRLIEQGLDDWFAVATERNTLAIGQYLKSSRYRSDSRQ